MISQVVHLAFFFLPVAFLFRRVCPAAAAASVDTNGTVTDSQASPLVGFRLPPFHYDNVTSSPRDTLLRAVEDGISCATGAICVGPLHDHYPVGHTPGVLFTSRFVVPGLPESHDSERTTYYDYYNIFWRQQPKGGYMNQFVPQLMLGNVLANSSNYPDYTPQWLVLDKWHIGAQYFMGLPCNKTAQSIEATAGGKDGPCWIAKAATGKLIMVEPGEVIETSFELIEVSDEKDWEWHLRIGVVGAHPSRWSLVVARQPFMGLVPGTVWQDGIYKNATVGSCLENYGMESSDNYPPLWKISMDIITDDATTQRQDGRGQKEEQNSRGSFAWDDWAVGGGPKCSWMPRSSLANVEGSTWQRASWTAALQGLGSGLRAEAAART